MSDERPKKLLRISRACDFCNKRSIKCRASEQEAGKCQNCYDFSIQCTYERPSKRGRASVPATATTPSQQQLAQTVVQTDPTPHVLLTRSLEGREKSQNFTNQLVDPICSSSTMQLLQTSQHLPDTAWRSFAHASRVIIESLVDIYHQIVYPIFPLFHYPTVLAIVQNREYLNSRNQFASIMAVCALASARVRDGALFGTNKNLAELELVEPASETFFMAAKDSLPQDLTTARDFGYLRTCAILAITSIQYGDIESMEMYLGHYFTILSIQRLHDEVYWPKTISNIEREERRRLYWSIYTLDIYTAVVWNSPVHAYGANAKVQYPSELDDEFITSSVNIVAPSLSSPSWLLGWNFTTDLYVILEQAANKARSHNSQERGRIQVFSHFDIPSFSPKLILQHIIDAYSKLPSSFKETLPVTGDRGKDIFGFQSANIQATLQLLRMVFLSGEKNIDVEQKCRVASELLAVFQSVPVAYLRAISTPLIHHLGGIGSILGSVMEGTLSEASCLKVQSMLLSMADLLESLESGLSHTAGRSQSLRLQAQRIEEYMRQQRETSGRAFIDNRGITVADSTVIATNPEGMHEHVFEDTLSQFQLPPELLEDWPWINDFSQDLIFFPGNPG